MKIETKFSNGDKVYAVFRGREKGKRIPCRICSGTSRVKISGEKFKCPKCHGQGGGVKYNPIEWIVHNGKIIICSIHIVKNVRDPLSVVYLATCGQFYERDLFTTLKEAETKCERRNNLAQKQ